MEMQILVVSKMEKLVSIQMIQKVQYLLAASRKSASRARPRRRGEEGELTGRREEGHQAHEEEACLLHVIHDETGGSNCWLATPR